MDNNTGSKKSPITFVIAVMATVCASLVAAQDIVPVSDIGGGTSVFVFRGASRAVAKKFVAPARTRRTKMERIESAKKVTNQYATLSKTAPRRTRTAAVDPNDSRMAKIKTMPREEASKLFAGVGEYYMFTKQGKTQEAISMLDLMIKDEPNNAAAIYQRAAAYETAGQTDKATAGYKKAVEIDPNYVPAWFQIGVAAYNRGDYKTALNAYQNVVRIQPDNYTAQANLASTYRQLERYSEANAAYKAAEPGNLKNPDHYSEWGFCLGKTNEWDNAIARLLTARELSPTAVDNTNLGWAYYNAAKLDKKNGNEEAAKAKFEQARTYLNTAVKQDPKLDAAYLNLGSTNNEVGDHEAAVTALNTALALHTGWVIAYNQLGLGYRGLNKLDLAITALNAAVNLDGNYIPGLYNLGSTQYAAGKKDDAKKTQARLQKLDKQLAIQLGNVIAGKLIDYGIKKATDKVPVKVPVKIPKFPFN